VTDKEPIPDNAVRVRHTKPFNIKILTSLITKPPRLWPTKIIRRQDFAYQQAGLNPAKDNAYTLESPSLHRARLLSKFSA
jgi:hypothetical protein